MPVEKLFTYEFDSGDDDPLIPADEGAWSLEGFGHAATLTTHFLMEGKIRRRAPYSDNFKILIGPPRQGSWVADFFVEFQNPHAWAGATMGLGLASVPGAFLLLRRLARRATGEQPENDAAQAFEEQQPGTFDALVEAVEPSLIRAHRVIEDDEITVKATLGRASFEFNRRTRRYIEESIFDDNNVRLRGNVASYNVNNKTGRVFLDQMQRTVPFALVKGVDARTEIALATSLQNYASHRIANSDIDITFRAKRAEDGRVKSIKIYNADFIFGVRR